MSIDSNANNIQVIVRVRPLNGKESSENSDMCVFFDPDHQNQVILDSKPDPKSFRYDWVGDTKTT